MSIKTYNEGMVYVRNTESRLKFSHNILKKERMNE